ncbi:hypothetical protein D3C71_648060 [compost metagenome]
MRGLLFFCTTVLFPIFVLAQPGTNDPTFNTFDGATYGDGSGFDETVYSTSLQADGKMIVGGWFTKYNGVPRDFITRINQDGSNDATFNIGTGFEGFSSEYIRTTVVQTDGKILAGGEFISFNGSNRKNIARLNSNGSLDATFNPGTSFNGPVYVIALQTDGKILVGGSFTQFNGTAVNRIVRLNSNGTLDATFNPGTGTTSSPINTIAIQSDGKITIGGNFSQFNGIPANRIIRLNPDGTPDASFNTGGGPGAEVQTITIQPDGKMLVGGNFNTWNGTAMGRIARLNTDGSLDAGFNTGTGFSSIVYSTAIQTDGKIIVGGNYTSFNGMTAYSITRLNTDGTMDITFNPGTGFPGLLRCVTIQTDGKIISGGNFSALNDNPRNRIARLNTDGSLDTTFISATGCNSQVVATAIQTDGKILVGGDFTTFNDVLVNRITRLHLDGTLDTAFHTGSGFSGQPSCITVLSDGKLIIGGAFSTFNGAPINEIVRLNSDGTLDNSFSTTGTGPNSVVSSTSIQPDGKIIVGGWFTSFSSSSKNRIARLNPNGTLDPTFNPGTGFNYLVYETKLQPDGKVLVGGAFNMFNGVVQNHIVRLNTNGSLDTSFHVSYVDESVSSIVLQPDGKIVVGGSFTFYQGNRNYITRVNSDGSNDLTFNIGTGFNSAVHTMVLQSDGKIIVGGDFTSYNGTPIKRIARLNIDGSLDLTFNPGLGFNDWVYATALQADGKVVVGGKFTPINGIPRNRIARLLTTCPPISPGTSVTNLNCFGDSNGAINLTPSGGTLPYTFDWGGGVTTEDRSGLTAGTYSVTITDASNCPTLFNAVVTQPNSLTVSPSVTNISCLGDANGAINLIPSGGTAPYTFNWSDGSTSEDRTGLDVGTYTVTISDVNGCSSNSGATITQPASVLSAATSITHIHCFGGTTGAIDLTPSGGTAPYTFIWNDGFTTEDRTGLLAGTYSVTITDTKGCSTNTSATVTQAVSTISALTNVTHVACFGGTTGAIDLTPNGGTLPYTFDWGVSGTTEDIAGLTAGIYSVTITDANGCAAIDVTVTQPASAVSAATSVTNVSCFGGSNGEINLTPVGGTFPYTFDWGNGITTEDRTGLENGAYSVNITDANSCSTIISASVTEPSPITNSFAATACYSYTWNAQMFTNSGSYTQVLTTANNCDSTVTLNLTIKNATANSITQAACNSFTLNSQTYTSSGTYVQHLTNTAGCDSTLTLNLTIKNPTTNSITQTACNSFTLNSQTYTSSGTYIQHLTNAAGCDSTLTLNLTIKNATTNSISQTACNSFALNGQTYASSGTYVQHLTNAAGCDSTLTLNLTIKNATTSSITQTVCNSYTLNGQTYTSSGTYTQNLTNATGCDSTLTLHLTINDSPNMTVVDNNDGSFTASPADSYQWIDCVNGNAITGATAQTFAATQNGTYAVIGTSNGGCSDTSACITINDLGLTEQNLFEISLVPNPTNDLVTIRFEGSNATLTICDAQGKSLTSQSVISGDCISLKNYADGVYFFEFIAVKGKATKRVVKN